MYREKLNAAFKSIFVNIFLLILKLIAGIITGSLGVLAEFIHSLFDLMASLFAYFGIKKAAEPADITHHYGHDRVENVSGLLQSILIAVTSLFIFYEAYNKFIKGNHVVRENLLGILVMVIGIVLDFIISNYLHKKSRKTSSPALEADAYHFTTDIWGAGAVIIGLGASALGFPLGDIIAAVFVAILMLILSVKLSLKSLKVMIDYAPDDSTVEGIAEIIAGYPGVRGYHTLRAREAGSRLLVDVCIHLDPKLSLSEAHRIAVSLEKKMKNELPRLREIIIHTEPDLPGHE